MFTTTKTVAPNLRLSHAVPFNNQPDLKGVACLVLGGGQGTRLFPLTQTRSKPAVPFGGRYRLVDVPLSSAIHAGCGKIYVLTQFLSASLHRHICSTYMQQSMGSSTIEILSAEQRPNDQQWFQGTADAVRKCKDYLADIPADYFLILSGDQLYQMDLRAMVSHAYQTDADLVIASLPVDSSTAKRMGILKIDGQSNIVDFIEKPQSDALLEPFICPQNCCESDQANYLASMGIYLFKRQALFALLESDPREDFGKHLIPTKVRQGGVSAYLYDGYWEDIGTVEAYYNANIALTRPEPFFNFYDSQYPLFSTTSQLPAPKIADTRLAHSVVCEGCVVEASEIRNSILGPRTVVKYGTVIRNSYCIGNDYYTSPMPKGTISDHMQIGRNCTVNRAIIDSHVCIGDNVQLINKQKLSHYDGDHVYIRDGIIIVTRGAHLKDGFVL